MERIARIIRARKQDTLAKEGRGSYHVLRGMVRSNWVGSGRINCSWVILVGIRYNFLFLQARKWRPDPYYLLTLATLSHFFLFCRQARLWDILASHLQWIMEPLVPWVTGILWFIIHYPRTYAEKVARNILFGAKQKYIMVRATLLIPPQ